VTASPSTAALRADIDARYDAHLAALRQHAAQLQATVARGAAPHAEPEPESESEPTS
jgi:hypothetical protein